MVDLSSLSITTFDPSTIMTSLTSWPLLLMINLSLGFLLLSSTIGFFFGRFQDAYLKRFPGPAPTSWIFGNLLEILEAEHGAMHEKWTRRFGSVFVYTCLFGRKRIAITDPKAINYVLMKADQYPRLKEELRDMEDWLGKGLVTAHGDRHRRQRKLLNPFFTPNELKQIAPVLEEKAQLLCMNLRKLLENDKSIVPPTGEKGVIAVDIFQWYNRTTVDIIAKTGFGQDYNLLGYPDGADGLISVMSRLFLSGGMKFTGKSFLMRTLLRTFPSLQTWIRTERVKAKEIARRALQVECKRIFEQRKDNLMSSHLDPHSEPTDLLSVLIKANSKCSSDAQIPEEEAIAQIATFVGAGSETSACFLSWLSLQLALHPTIQERLRNEILKAQVGSDESSSLNVPFDVLTSLPYLEAVCRETMRFCPPVSSLLRVATQTDRIPLSEPIRLRAQGRDGSDSLLHEISVEPGQTILIPISAYQRSEKKFGPSANRFDPDRWLTADMTSSDHSSTTTTTHHVSNIGIWSGLLGFGSGPKGCIGWRLALMEIKLIIASILIDFKLHESDLDLTDEDEFKGSKLPRLGTKPKIERRGNTIVKPKISNYSKHNNHHHHKLNRGCDLSLKISSIITNSERQ